MSEATPFNVLPGVRSGRVASAWDGKAGDWSVCLGSTVPGVAYDFNLDDLVGLEQTADVTGLKLVCFRALLVPPASYPAGAAWEFSWGVGSTVHGKRKLTLGRSQKVVSGAIDVSRLSGNQSLRFVLKVVSA